MKPEQDSTRDNAVCDFCLSTCDNNRRGDYEAMLFCHNCEAKAHPSCMSYSKELAEKALSYPWQCIECKTCTVCCSARDGDNILFCDSCDKAFHMDCHIPVVEIKPEGKWVCYYCETDVELNTDREITANNNGFEHSPHSVQQSEDEIVFNESSEIPSNSIEWSVDEVTSYFDHKGFEKQSYVFVSEEIDGKSLLLLRRNDVISGLALKLGPAVKIYEHVVKLQTAALSYEPHKHENGVT